MLAIEVLPATAAANTTSLYVSPAGSDSSPGTDVQPLRTIARAATLAAAGTTVIVAPGTYSEPMVSSSSGTPTGRIRFVSSVRWAAQIRTAGAYRAWLNFGNYVDIDGFDISAAGAHLGIQNEGSYVHIQNNHVHHVASTVNATACDPNGGAGIVN